MVFMPDNSNVEIRGMDSLPLNLNEFLQRFKLRENGGRRLGINRRQNHYSLHIPERRNGYDRRVGHDRRKTPRIGSRLSFNSQLPH